MKYSVIIVAAGSSTRFNTASSKLLYPLSDGKVVIEHTLDVFKADQDCTQIILVVNNEVLEFFKGKKLDGRMMFCMGGNSRQESVYNGLLAVKEDYVLVHDGARCFLLTEDLENLKKEINEQQAAILCKSMTDTVKVTQDGFIKNTLDRNVIKRAQTPQGFYTDILVESYIKAGKDSFVATDDAQIVEVYGNCAIKCVESIGDNNKVTFLSDVKGDK